MKTLSIKSIFLSLLIALVGGLFLGATAGLPALPISGGLFAASFMPGKSGVALMAIEKEIWINDIVGNLFKANPHLNFAMNADEFVLNGKVVHIPNAGAKPTVVRNRKKFPATVTLRQDSDITFVLDEFTSDPIKIENADKYELSYNKRMSVMNDQSAALNELIGDWFYYYWAPTALTTMFRTTGASVSAHYGTGNRKKVQLTDIKKMQLAVWKSNAPRDGWVASLDANLMDQLTDEFTPSQYRDFAQHYDAVKGILGKLYGFTFLDPRSTVLTYNNASTPVPFSPEDEITSTGNGAGLFWHPNMVIRALGDKEFFEDEGNPTQYGDIYSALVRAGGRKKRADGEGVYTLVQDSV